MNNKCKVVGLSAKRLAFVMLNAVSVSSALASDVAMEIDNETINGYYSTGEEIAGLVNLETGGLAEGVGRISQNWDVDRYRFTIPEDGMLVVGLEGDRSSLNIKAGSSRGAQNYFRSVGRSKHSKGMHVGAGAVVHLTIWDQDTASAYNYKLKIDFEKDGSCQSREIPLAIDNESVNGYGSNGELIAGLENLDSGEVAVGQGRIYRRWDVDRYVLQAPKSGVLIVSLDGEEGSLNIKAGSVKGSQNYFRSEREAKHVQEINVDAGDTVHLTVWDQLTSSPYNYRLRFHYFEGRECSAGSSSGMASLSDYDFVGGGYGRLTMASTPAPGVQKPYIPDLTHLSEYKKIYISPNGLPESDGSSPSNPTSIDKVFPSIDWEARDMEPLKKTVVIALDGTYMLDKVLFLPEMEDVVFIAKNKHGARLVLHHGPLDYKSDPEGQPEGLENSIFQLPGRDGKPSHKVNGFSIIGFEAYPLDRTFYELYKKEYYENNKNYQNYTRMMATRMHDREFIRGVSSSDGFTSINRVYLSDMLFHHFSSVVYTDLGTHDWTIDKSVYHDSNGSYLWYMQGWHHSVINTVMYDGDDYSLSIRGYGKIDKSFVDRIPGNDWTHLIANNTFGSNGIYNRDRDGGRGHHIGIYSSSSDSSFMPQNVLIKNNAFIDNGDFRKIPMYVNVSGMRDNMRVQYLEGLVVTGNFTDKDKMVNIEGSGSLLGQHDFSLNQTAFSNFQFVSDQMRNYSLTSDSGLIDGAMGWAPNVDVNGKPRSGAADVGAYEAR